MHFTANTDTPLRFGLAGPMEQSSTAEAEVNIQSGSSAVLWQWKRGSGSRKKSLLPSCLLILWFFDSIPIFLLFSWLLRSLTCACTNFATKTSTYNAAPGRNKVCLFRWSACVCACVRVYVRACVRACMCAYVSACVRACLSAYMRVCTLWLFSNVTN